MPIMLQTRTAVRGIAMSALLISPLLAAPVMAAPVVAASANQAQPNKIQKGDILDKASDMATATGQASRDVWTKMNTELTYSDATYDIRNKAMGVIRPVDTALGGGLNWTDNKMSRPALFLMLAFLAVITLLSLSSATARTGNHH